VICLEGIDDGEVILSAQPTPTELSSTEFLALTRAEPAPSRWPESLQQPAAN